MEITVTFTREENKTYYGCDSKVMDIEEYLRGVVPSEIGNANIAACRAQAVAARTFAMARTQGGKAISDASSTAQAFRSSRLGLAYQQAHQGVIDTMGEVLYYNGKLCDTCVYSASNGGRIVSSEEKWGGKRGYLVSKPDPYDTVAKNGHGVGMSQAGAKKMGSLGYSYEEILAFYYPGTVIFDTRAPIREEVLEEPEHAEEYIEGDIMDILASDLIEKCKTPLNEKWGYIWGEYGGTWTAAKQKAATREMTVKYGSKWIGHPVLDCSGLLYWAFKQLDGYMYHGSNTIWNKYCVTKGTLSSKTMLKPGSAVFLNKNGNRHHVGIYIGNNTCIESAGTQTGVTTSKLSHWDEWGEMKGVNYNLDYENVITYKTTTIQKGSSGVLVIELQEGLIKLGYDCGAAGADGKFGAATETAVKAFQTKYGLTVDGICGENTWVKLNTLLGTEDDQEADSVENEPLQPETVLYKAKVCAQTGDTVNMRESESTDAAIVKVIKIGEIVNVLREGTWSKIAYDGHEGYMMSKYLTKDLTDDTVINEDSAWCVKVVCANETEARNLATVLKKLANVTVEKV